MDWFGAGYVATLFGGYLLLWRQKRLRQLRQTGEDPDVLGCATRPLQRYFARMLRVMTMSLILLFVLHTAGFAWPGLLRLAWLDSRWADRAGFGLGLAGLGLCRVAQRAMGAAWRVGIDDRRTTPLVEEGIYTATRNPTYLGLFLVNGGVWLIWPTASMATFAIIFFVLLEVQVRCEEEHLEAVHGEAFRSYRARTHRYLPFLY